MDNDWVTAWLEKMTTKVAAESKRLAGATPYMPYDGHYSDVVAERGADWWANGFWSGLLWQLFHYTKQPSFKQTALLQEKRLDKALYEFKDIHHDVGFMWLLTSVAHYRLTGDQQAYRTGLHAANLLAGRFNITGNFLVAWNDHPGWCIIDSMMNVQLLYWASAETADPRFAKIATRHAQTIAQYLVRTDGSVGHIASFDAASGAFIEQLAGQGASADSAWSRGQAWAIYGFALTYRHTKLPEFLVVAQRVADYFISQMGRSNDVPLADFRAPALPNLHDTSAAMIAACGLLELANWAPTAASSTYHQAAVQLLQASEARYADWSLMEDGVIGGGTEAYHRPATYEVPLIYSDYFFTEALLRLQGQALFVW
ncbi:glycoside hydrolase family 88 protein [Loigolactobacillus jiayinensis]|uniref:Glycoside hydrolase family 88 protein n=1 Tax=Loigolactobacillus jiayinensis TaxID=2486016 RepID=A0ABW1RC52_9LACO|nr:glycoside hydrolase family 88 protein [Loigolactobacillus jiayinensis]